MISSTLTLETSQIFISKTIPKNSFTVHVSLESIPGFLKKSFYTRATNADKSFLWLILQKISSIKDILFNFFVLPTYNNNIPYDK